MSHDNGASVSGTRKEYPFNASVNSDLYTARVFAEGFFALNKQRTFKVTRGGLPRKKVFGFFACLRETELSQTP